MKNILKIIPLFIFALSCKAQTPIIDINNRPDEDIIGAYYKDINNLLDPFVGNYIGTSRGNTLQIILQKVTNFGPVYDEDMIIGEYKYTKRGVVIVDRLNELNVTYDDQRNHAINGNGIVEYGDYICDNCLPGEIQFRGGIVDRITQNNGGFHIIRTTVNGQPAIKVWIGWEAKGRRYDEPPSPALIPGSYHVLIKQ